MYLAHKETNFGTVIFVHETKNFLQIPPQLSFRNINHLSKRMFSIFSNRTSIT
jgi:hypothetical protein